MVSKSPKVRSSEQPLNNDPIYIRLCAIFRSFHDSVLRAIISYSIPLNSQLVFTVSLWGMRVVF